MQIKALALAFATLMAGAAAAATGPILSSAKPVTRAEALEMSQAVGELAKRYQCPGHVSAYCTYYYHSACCSYFCDDTGVLMLDECEGTP
jgi:hypothetical protein